MTPPCEAYTCTHTERCKTEQLACDALLHFVRYGQVIEPGNKVTWAMKRGKKVRVIKQIETTPTRDKYEQAMLV